MGGYLILGPDIRAWRPDIETLPTGFIYFPVFFAIYLWIGADVSRVFRTLRDNGCFAKPDHYVAFVERARESFLRPWTWILGIVLAVATTLFVNFALWNGEPKPWFDDTGQGPLLFPRLLGLVLVTLLAYAISQIVIREALAIVWWRRMWDEMGGELTLHPHNSDGAAGLGSLGRHALGISYFLLVMTVFVFMGSLLPSLRYGNNVVFAAADTVTVNSAPAAAGRLERSDSTSPLSFVTRVTERGRPTVVFAIDRMALENARVLHIRVDRMPSNSIAMDAWIPIPDSATSDTMSVKAVQLHTPVEQFSVRFETTPLPATAPTLRVAGLTLSLWNPLLMVEWVLLLGAIALSLGPLLWPAHEAMERAVHSQLDALSTEIDEHMRDANAHRSVNPQRFAAAMDAAERTKKLHATLTQDAKTWPLSAQLRRRLGISSGISISSSVVNLLFAGGLNVLRQIA